MRDETEKRQRAPMQSNQCLRTLVAVLTISTVGSVACTVYMSRQVLRISSQAEQRREECDRLETELGKACDELHDTFALSLDSTGLDDVTYANTLSRAVAFHEHVVSNNELEPYRNRLLQSWSKLTDLYYCAGDQQKLESALRSILATHVDGVCGDDDRTQCNQSSAATLARLGDLLMHQNRGGEARDAYEVSCKLWRSLPTTIKTDEPNARIIIDTHEALISLLRVQGDLEANVRVHEQLIKFLENDCRTLVWQKYAMPAAHFTHSMALFRANQLDAAGAALERGESLIDEMTEGMQREFLRVQRDLLRAALLARTGQTRESERMYDRFTESISELCRSDLDVLDLVEMLGRFGDLCNEADRSPEAEFCYRKAIEFHDEIDRSRTTIDFEAQFVQITRSLAVLVRAQGSLDEAIEMLENSVARIRAARRRKPNDPTAPVLLADQLAGLGYFYYQAGNWDAAVDAMTECVETCEPLDAGEWLILSIAHHHSHDPNAARRWYDRAADWLQRHGPADGSLQNLLVEAAALLGEDVHELVQTPRLVQSTP